MLQPVIVQVKTPIPELHPQPLSHPSVPASTMGDMIGLLFLQPWPITDHAGHTLPAPTVYTTITIPLLTEAKCILVYIPHVKRNMIRRMQNAGI